MKKMLFASALCLSAALAARAGIWACLDDENWYSGPKLDDSQLIGKVVVVYEWSVMSEECELLLPRIEAVWQSFKSKPFMVIGSHRGGRAKDLIAEKVKKYHLTFPVYERAGLLDGEPKSGDYPFFYVVDSRGRAYGFSGVNEATEKLTTAIAQVGAPIPLVSEELELKRHKGIEKKLVFGKNVAQIVKQLQKEVQKSKDKVVAEEAGDIITSIEEAKMAIDKDIEILCTNNPADAIKMINMYLKTWPKSNEAAEYKAKLPELKVAAAEAKKKGSKKK